MFELIMPNVHDDDEENDLNDQEEAAHVQHSQCERTRIAHWPR